METKKSDDTHEKSASFASKIIKGLRESQFTYTKSLLKGILKGTVHPKIKKYIFSLSPVVLTAPQIYFEKCNSNVSFQKS